METYRVEATVSKDGTLIITRLSFLAGEKVEVILHRQEPEQRAIGKRYPLRGEPLCYPTPFDTVAEDEWEAMA